MPATSASALSARGAGPKRLHLPDIQVGPLSARHNACPLVGASRKPKASKKKNESEDAAVGGQGHEKLNASVDGLLPWSTSEKLSEFFEKAIDGRRGALAVVSPEQERLQAAWHDIAHLRALAESHGSVVDGKAFVYSTLEAILRLVPEDTPLREVLARINIHLGVAAFGRPVESDMSTPLGSSSYHLALRGASQLHGLDGSGAAFCVCLIPNASKAYMWLKTAPAPIEDGRVEWNFEAELLDLEECDNVKILMMHRGRSGDQLLAEATLPMDDLFEFGLFKGKLLTSGGAVDHLPERQRPILSVYVGPPKVRASAANEPIPYRTITERCKTMSSALNRKCTYLQRILTHARKVQFLNPIGIGQDRETIGFWKMESAQERRKMLRRRPRNGADAVTQLFDKAADARSPFVMLMVLACWRVAVGYLKSMQRKKANLTAASATYRRFFVLWKCAVLEWKMEKWEEEMLHHGDERMQFLGHLHDLKEQRDHCREDVMFSEAEKSKRAKHVEVAVARRKNLATRIEHSKPEFLKQSLGNVLNLVLAAYLRMAGLHRIYVRRSMMLRDFSAPFNDEDGLSNVTHDSPEKLVRYWANYHVMQFKGVASRMLDSRANALTSGSASEWTAKEHEQYGERCRIVRSLTRILGLSTDMKDGAVFAVLFGVLISQEAVPLSPESLWLLDARDPELRAENFCNTISRLIPTRLASRLFKPKDILKGNQTILSVMLAAMFLHKPKLPTVVPTQELEDYISALHDDQKTAEYQEQQGRIAGGKRVLVMDNHNDEGMILAMLATLEKASESIAYEDMEDMMRLAARGETKSELLGMPPPKLLLRWFNKQLAAAGSDTVLGSWASFKKGSCGKLLLTILKSLVGPVLELLPEGKAVRKLEIERTSEEAAQAAVLACGERCTTFGLLTQEALQEAQTDVIAVFLASLFICTPGLKPKHSSELGGCVELISEALIRGSRTGGEDESSDEGVAESDTPGLLPAKGRHKSPKKSFESLTFTLRKPTSQVQLDPKALEGLQLFGSRQVSGDSVAEGQGRFAELCRWFRQSGEALHRAIAVVEDAHKLRKNLEERLLAWSNGVMAQRALGVPAWLDATEVRQHVGASGRPRLLPSGTLEELVKNEMTQADLQKGKHVLMEEVTRLEAILRTQLDFVKDIYLHYAHDVGSAGAGKHEASNADSQPEKADNKPEKADKQPEKEAAAATKANAEGDDANAAGVVSKKTSGGATTSSQRGFWAFVRSDNTKFINLRCLTRLYRDCRWHTLGLTPGDLELMYIEVQASELKRETKANPNYKNIGGMNPLAFCQVLVCVAARAGALNSRISEAFSELVQWYMKPFAKRKITDMLYEQAYMPGIIPLLSKHEKMLRMIFQAYAYLRHRREDPAEHRRPALKGVVKLDADADMTKKLMNTDKVIDDGGPGYMLFDVNRLKLEHFKEMLEHASIHTDKHQKQRGKTLENLVTKFTDSKLWQSNVQACGEVVEKEVKQELAQPTMSRSKTETMSSRKHATQNVQELEPKSAVGASKGRASIMVLSKPKKMPEKEVQKQEPPRTEIYFMEFVDVLCALTLYIVPSPFKPFTERFEEFLTLHLIEGLARMAANNAQALPAGLGKEVTEFSEARKADKRQKLEASLPLQPALVAASTREATGHGSQRDRAKPQGGRRVQVFAHNRASASVTLVP
eukprot:TRINITY_DN10974_c0_g1_i4.p1 TRINITY_DN10974_c0_g1~~TRINITY_DN10974_c0_g1_i4.p1  ORF type:complete len:1679 (-),score=453.49 TRINITY_DN10974_c0_g1_i4:98-5134(-)